IENAEREGKTQIATFGGAVSSHIVATAAAGKLQNLKTAGIIRGERARNLSHTLLNAQEYGMQLFFISREDYQNKNLPPEIRRRTDVYLIKEGGYGFDGARRAQEILYYCRKEGYSHIACAVGTSTMMAGLVRASLPTQEVLGVSVLKGHGNLENDLP